MSAPFLHVHVSEREGAHDWPDGQHDDARWEDCSWCSAVMFARQAHDPSIPATHEEAELLRAAADEIPTGGSSPADVRRGLIARYRFNPPSSLLSPATMWAALDLGHVGLITGSMGAFPDGHRLRRFSPSFDGAHSIFAARLDETDRVWWDDPLAPKGSYDGEWVTRDELLSFAAHLPGAAHLVAPQCEETSVAFKAITSEAPATMDAPAGTVMYQLDGLTKCGSLATAVTARYSPYEAKPYRAMYATINNVRRLVLVAPAAGSVKPVADSTPFGQADLDAAEAEGHSAGVADEKARMRAELGL